VLNGLLIGLLIGFPYGLFLGQGQAGKNISIITTGVTFWLLGGLIFGLTEGLLGIQVAEIRPVEVFSWSWKDIGWNLVRFLSLGVLASLVIGFLVVLFIVITDWINSGTTTDVLSVIPGALLLGLQIARSLMPAFALFAGLIGGLIGGLSGNMLKESELVKPNQGMQRSAINPSNFAQARRFLSRVSTKPTIREPPVLGCVEHISTPTRGRSCPG
jgi:hypothetical protein